MNKIGLVLMIIGLVLSPMTKKFGINLPSYLYGLTGIFLGIGIIIVLKNITKKNDAG